MSRLLSGLSLLLFYCSGYATLPVTKVQVQEEATASPIVIIVFGILFVGFCVGFTWMVYTGSKKSKQVDAGGDDASGTT